MKFELIWRWLVTDVDTLTLLCFSLFIRSNKPCPRLTLRIMFLKNTTIFDSIIPNTMYRSRKTENLSHKKYSCCCFSFFFSIRLLSVLRGHSVFSSPPQRPMTSDIEGFSIPDCIHYIYFPILILEKEPIICHSHMGTPYVATSIYILCRYCIFKLKWFILVYPIYRFPHHKPSIICK